eukprot:TRINITY_DN24216_c3_g1_i2.p1 TRINITY_DN24216_c3_g1~~TRINITY_DN24216_c3_g1_i2.p1  ORF type:complete len:172 (-),score=1.77 TRINITY_DN24216_c3_g1_i2:178-693(-)
MSDFRAFLQVVTSPRNIFFSFVSFIVTILELQLLKQILGNFALLQLPHNRIFHFYCCCSTLQKVFQMWATSGKYFDNKLIISFVKKINVKTQKKSTVVQNSLQFQQHLTIITTGAIQVWHVLSKNQGVFQYSESIIPYCMHIVQHGKHVLTLHHQKSLIQFFINSEPEFYI